MSPCLEMFFMWKAMMVSECPVTTESAALRRATHTHTLDVCMCKGEGWGNWRQISKGNAKALKLNKQLQPTYKRKLGKMIVHRARERVHNDDTQMKRSAHNTVC